MADSLHVRQLDATHRHSSPPNAVVMARCRRTRAVGMWRARVVFAVVCALISRITPAWAFAASFPPSVQVGREAWTTSRAQRQLAEDDASGAFSSWLAAFAFTFPNEKFVLQYARIQVELSGLCTNTRIGKVDSELDVEAAQLAVDVNDVEFDCALSWMVEDYYGNRAVGDARANVSQSSAQAAVAVDVDDEDELRPPLPRDVRLTNCAMNLIVQELAFSGGKFASILNAASVAIRKELGHSLNTASCKQATKALTRFSETTLPQEERALAQYFTPIDPLPFPIHAHAVDLGSNKLRRWLAFMVEHYISAQQGTRSIGAFAKWLEDQNERNHAYNAKVIQVPPLWLIDPETKQPKLSIAMPRDILGDALDDLRFIVYEMKILDLETANALHGPDVVVSGNDSELLTSFNFGVGWEKITLNVSGVLEVLPTAVELDPFLEPLTVSFELRNPQFNTTFGLAIDSIASGALRGARATNPSCLALTVIQTRVRALDFSGAPAEVVITPWRIGKAANASDDTLEASLDRLIAQASKLLAETLSEALEDTIKHQLGSTVRGAFDDALQRRIESIQAENTCPTVSKASHRLSALKLGLSAALLYGAGVCLVLFALLMFGYSSVVVFAWKCMKKTYTLLWRCVHGDDDENDGGAQDEENSLNTAQTVATPQSSRRNYSRAMFNRCGGGGDDDDDDVSATIDDDTSMITESLLGDAEIDDEGNIDIDAKSLSRRQAALYKSLVVSKRAQFGLPILYVMTVMLFLASNLRVGATVNVRASMGSSGLTDNISDVIIHDVFIFGLFDTVTNMWRAGVYVLSILILLFSGVWPYVKLALMFKAWFLPFDSSKERGALLAKLDAFGKWSLLDAFVMILFMVLFHFEVSTNDGGDGGDFQTFASLTVTVDPKPGFFIFLFATFLSMILGQVTSLYHDLDEADRDGKQHVQQEIDENPDDVAVDHETRRSLIWMQATCGADVSQDAAMQITVGVCGSALIIATFVLLMLGMKAIAIEINFLGVAGAALGPTASNKALSLVSVATDVPKTVAYRGVIRATLVTFAFIVPLARIMFVMLLWLAPLTRRQRRAFWRVKDVIDAWSALDVLVFSFVAAMLQIRQFLGFMTGGNCDALNVTLQQLVEGPVNEGRDLCFDVDARIHVGCALFALSVCGSVASAALLNTYKAKDQRNAAADDEF